MEITEKETYYYKGFNEHCSGVIVVCSTHIKSNRVSVSRNLETRTNAFYVNGCDLVEIISEEESHEREVESIKNKYNKKLDYLNTHSVVKDLKRYSEEDLRKIFNGIVKDLKKI
jgi:hypothetical protein